MIERAEIRSQVYGVLSIAFSPPREGLGCPGAPRVAALVLRGAAGALQIALPERALAAIEESRRRATINLDQGGAGELEVEYNRLFVGPGRPRVYPYESLYRDSAGLVMGPSAGKALEAYRRNGLAINGEFKDLPDHLAVELEFMARLCRDEAKAESAGDVDEALRLKQEQRVFLDTHLADWLPALCEKVIRETSSTFYRGSAEIAAIFVAWDREELATPEVIETETRV